MKFNRKKLIFTATVIIIFNSIGFSKGWNPTADPKAVVISNDVRITVLTPRLLRLEWAENAAFEDHATLTFVNRRTDVPLYKTTQKDGFLTIETDSLALHYKIGSGRFTQDNLLIDVNTGGMQATWHFGDTDDKNLLGTTRTLDGCNGNHHDNSQTPIELGKGILSLNGWSVVDDSERPLFDNSDWPWVVARPDGNRQDIYFFGYGYDYKAAMKDFITVAGRIAMPPRFTFGAWWSKYWNFNDSQFRNLVEQYHRYDLGLDVLVIDMDWHITSLPQWYDVKGQKMNDQAGQWSGWTGFTWNRNYFPDPDKFLEWTNKNSIKTCLNLHPASGIQPHEEKYPEIAKAMGIDPETKKYVPFDIVNKKFVNAYLNLLLKPMEQKGIDFWWLDWQQWNTTKIPGVNPTFYLNYIHYSNMERQDKVRPLIFHRWGGLGNHRYQIGFSGDTVITWESLAYQPYFTATASNVGFGYWSHDIGGHYSRNDVGLPHDGELYTRWIQWGVLSPIFRTHATANPEIERRPWAYSMEYFQAMRKAYDLRYALLPYIYTTARQAYDTGISLCRPLYYDWPRQKEAYSFSDEYMFGDDLLVNPIVQPTEKGKKYVLQKTWLPEGQWLEYATGKIFTGPAVIESPFMLDEIPVYVKAGSIVPMAPKMNNTDQKPVDPLILNIFPGSSGKTSIYEDAGNDQTFKDGQFAFTDVAFTRENEKTTVIINPIRGGYDKMPKARSYRIKLVNTFPPKSVKLNGHEISYSDNAGGNRWSYDGGEVTTIIDIGRQKVKKTIKIVVESDGTSTQLLSGIKGKLKRLEDFVDYAGRPWEPMYQYEPVERTALAGIRMAYDPSKAVDEVSDFDAHYRNVLQIIENRSAKNENWKPYLELLQLN